MQNDKAEQKAKNNRKERLAMSQFYLNSEYVPVPLVFIEKFLPHANATFVKIYLYSLGIAAQGGSADYSAIASALGLLESDVMQAFNYWAEKGILKNENDNIIFGNMQTDSAPVSAPPKPMTDAPAERSGRPSYAPSEVANAIADNSTLSEMVMLAQEILGKTLNPSDTETLYWFYDGLKFSPEVILMLLEYCVSKEKRRMSYIEKVAVSWHERGITSMEAVNDYIKKDAERSGYIYSVRKLLGITDRALSQSEEQFINRWHEMYKMDEDMISLAYEQCIIQTAKLSFPYMEKILERWYKQGIHTPEQAEQDNRAFRNSQVQNQGPADVRTFGIYSDNYDHEKLEKLTRKKYD